MGSSLPPLPVAVLVLAQPHASGVSIDMRGKPCKVSGPVDVVSEGRFGSGVRQNGALVQGS